MPIQNVGTLLENLVVTEAAVALLRLCHESAPFEFVNSFAMPSLTPWCTHAQNAGFDPATLERVRSAGESSAEGATYPMLLRASLRFAAELGPDAALLVAGASLKTGVPCRMWLNDIRDGHYGDAIPLLEEIDALANAIYGVEQGATRTFSLCVSEANYPDSIIELAKVLDDWHPRGGARLGS